MTIQEMEIKDFKTALKTDIESVVKQLNEFFENGKKTGDIKKPEFKFTWGFVQTNLKQYDYKLVNGKIEKVEKQDSKETNSNNYNFTKEETERLKKLIDKDYRVDLLIELSNQAAREKKYGLQISRNYKCDKEDTVSVRLNKDVRAKLDKCYAENSHLKRTDILNELLWVALSNRGY